MIEEKFDRIKIFRESRLITEWFINYVIPLAFFAMSAMILPWPYTFVPSDDSNVCWIYFMTTAPFRYDDINDINTTVNFIWHLIWPILELILLLCFWREIQKEEKIQN